MYLPTLVRSRAGVLDPRTHAATAGRPVPATFGRTGQSAALRFAVHADELRLPLQWLGLVLTAVPGLLDGGKYSVIPWVGLAPRPGVRWRLGRLDGPGWLWRARRGWWR